MVTLAEAQTLRAMYLAAQEAIATGKSYRIGTRELTRADEAFVARKFAEYDQLVSSLSSGGNGGLPVFRFVPRDL